MMITIYNGPRKYMTHCFKPQELDNIKQICYSMGIKWYTISYTDKEREIYERFSQTNN